MIVGAIKPLQKPIKFLNKRKNSNILKREIEKTDYAKELANVKPNVFKSAY